MDESWRVTMGSNLPNARRRPVATGAPPPPLAPEDFKDVFGGPPKTLLRRHYRQLYGNRSPFDDVFRPVNSWYYETASSVGGSRRRDVGVTSEVNCRVADGFYDDIFGSKGGSPDRRRRFRTNSSSTIWSSENLSSHVDSFRYYASKIEGLDLEDYTFSSFTSKIEGLDLEDYTFSSFTSKLRQISIPTRHNSPSMTSSSSCDNTTMNTARRDDISWQLKPSSATIHLRSPRNSKSVQKTDDDIKYSGKYDPNPSMWTINKMWQKENQPDVDLDDDDDGDDSVCSSTSSSSSDSRVRIAHEKALRDLAREVVVEIDDDEDVWNLPTPYLVRASSHNLFGDRRREETEGEAAVDEAIAWARENLRIRTESSTKESVC